MSPNMLILTANAILLISALIISLLTIKGRRDRLWFSAGEYDKSMGRFMLSSCLIVAALNCAFVALLKYAGLDVSMVLFTGLLIVSIVLLAAAQIALRRMKRYQPKLNT